MSPRLRLFLSRDRAFEVIPKAVRLVTSGRVFQMFEMLRHSFEFLCFAFVDPAKASGMLCCVFLVEDLFEAVIADLVVARFLRRRLPVAAVRTIIFAL